MGEPPRFIVHTTQVNMCKHNARIVHVQKKESLYICKYLKNNKIRTEIGEHI